MKFKNFRLLIEHTHVDNPSFRVGPGYFEGQEGQEWDGQVVGKVRSWDWNDPQYILYSDGDLILADLMT